ncbi:hypothetical protein [Guptibacillus hwajinpoensis]
MADYIVLVVYILGIAWFGARFEKKKQINISLEETSKLYFPYLVDYIKGNRRELYMVDGVTGKVDLPMKDSFLHHLKNQLKHSSI